MYRLLRPLVFRLDAERAHRATIAALRWRSGTGFSPATPWIRGLESKVAGLTFPNPVGLAAGFDKDAEVFGPMLNLGFGSVEIGTVTPLRQAGNSTPRLFRLVEDEAVINRLGFNNRGQAAAATRLAGRTRSHGVVGVNIGANKDSPDRIADYASGVRAMAPVADYLTINISSPNTSGLRDLQAGGELIELLAAVSEARVDGVPVFLKVAPDQGSGDHQRIVRAAIDSGIDALIVANTTLSRPVLKSLHAGESGGLSGAPLRELALNQLRLFRAASGGQLPLIAVGGIASAEDAWARIVAGASLVQLYSALVYHGPGLARRITKGLATILEREEIASIADAVGTES